MINGFLAGRHPSYQFFMLIILWFVSFALINMVVAFVLLTQYGFENFEKLSEDLQQGNIAANTLKWMQMLLSAGMFLIPSLMMPMLLAQKSTQMLSLKKPDNTLHFLFIIPLVLLAFPFIITLIEINQNITLPSMFSGWESELKQSELDSEKLLKRLLYMENTEQFLLNIVMAAIFPAIFEEFFFRGIMQKILLRLYQNIHVAIIVTACIFSYIHFQFYGFLPRFFLGIFFGYLVYWTKSIWYPILAHFLYNGLQILVLYLSQNKMVEVNMDTPQKMNPFIAFAATGLFFWSVFYFYRKTNDSSKIDEA